MRARTGRIKSWLFQNWCDRCLLARSWKETFAQRAIEQLGDALMVRRYRRSASALMLEQDQQATTCPNRTVSRRLALFTHFSQLTVVTNTDAADGPRYNICSSSPHLALRAAMRANNSKCCYVA